MLHSAIDEVRSRQKIPLLVGGTAYFLESIIFHRLAGETGTCSCVGRSYSPENTADSIRGTPSDIAAAQAQVEELATQGLSLYEQLERSGLSNWNVYLKSRCSVDPNRARKLHPNDSRKLTRSNHIQHRL